MRFSPLAGAASAVACLAVAISGTGLAQPESHLVPSGSAADLSSYLELKNLAAQRREAIDAEISANGPYSAAAVDELEALAFLYREIGDVDLAVQSLEQALQIERANSGLFSLEQVPLIEQLIDAERARGSGTAAQELERQLVELAHRHPTDPRSADILRRAGDRQVELFRLYVERVLQPPVHVSIGFAGNMTRSRPLPFGRSLTLGAEQHYLDAISVLLRSGSFDRDALEELEMKLLHAYHLELTQTEIDGGRMEAIARLGREAYQRLLTYAKVAQGPPDERARALVGLGDWELLFSRNSTALERYREAYALLAEAGGYDGLLAELFTPATPVALPTFAAERFAPSTSDGRYVELTFDISKYGKSREIQVTGLRGEAADQAARALVRAIARSRFRPMLVDGEPVRASSVVVRYGF